MREGREKAGGGGEGKGRGRHLEVEGIIGMHGGLRQAEAQPRILEGNPPA